MPWLCAIGHVTPTINAKAGLQPIASNGALYFFARDRYAGYTESLRLMQRQRYPFEVVDAEQGRKCFPQFRWESHEMAIYEPCAGQTSPLAFADAALSIGERHGLQVRSDVEVTSIEQRRGAYRLTTCAGTIAARTLICAGGARMLPLLGAFGVALQAKELSAVIAAPCDAPNFFDRETLEYGGFASKHHAIVSTTRPTRMCRTFTAIGESKALDCYSVDRLGVRTSHPNLIVAGGWGGTAFKLALGIASRIAQRLTTRSDDRVSA